MYEYIIGKYIGFIRDYIVVENNGIGYKVFTSGSTVASIPKIGEDVKLYTEQIVREDFIGIYGFYSYEELDMFKLLLSVNGVGPKAALSLLSISNVNNLRYAIASNDTNHLCKGVGIGKKTASRIVLELKDKLQKDNINYDELEENGTSIAEAMSALISLGYSEKEAEKALKNVDTTESVENIIKNSLKELMM